jgi:general secretion pathway protein G
MVAMQTTARVQKVRRRAGFTLIEIVVVVLLIGIIAATAAPRMFDTAATAKVNTALQSLSVLRDAIELYKATPGNNDTYPPGTDLAAELRPFIKGPLPKVQVPGSPNDASVLVDPTPGGGILPAAVDGNTDWLYDNGDGTLIINNAAYDDY